VKSCSHQATHPAFIGPGTNAKTTLFNLASELCIVAEQDQNVIGFALEETAEKKQEKTDDDRSNNREQS